jgi:hypothetical protein
MGTALPFLYCLPKTFEVGGKTLDLTGDKETHIISKGKKGKGL